MVAVKVRHGQRGPGGGAALLVEKGQRMDSQDCGLLSLAGIRRSTVVRASRAGCASCLGPVAVEGGVSETRTDSRTATIEAHWAQVLGADLAEGSQRPAGIPGARDGEAARLSDPPGRGVFAPFLDSLCLALLPARGS